MKIYKITDQKKLQELANKTKKKTVISTIVVLILIAGITLFLILKDGKKIPVLPLTLVILLFIVLFTLMIKQVNDMLYTLNKHRFVKIDNDAVTVGISAAFKENLNFIQKYFFNRINRFGTHNDKTFFASKIKSIKERKNGIQLKVSGLVGDIVTIPKEMDNLAEIKQEITKMIPS